MSAIKIGSDLREIRLDGSLGRVVQHWHLREAMGLKAGKLPEGNFGPVVVGDTEVYLLSRESAGFGRPKSRRPHRVVARCNHCRQEVPAGKFGQHLRACKGKGGAR